MENKLRVPIRFYLNEKEDGIQADCISLKGISFFAAGKARGDREVLDKLISEVQAKVQSYVDKKERVPWISPHDPDFVPLSGYHGDGGNQTIWIDVNLEDRNNLPHGFALVQCIACEKELKAEYFNGKPPEVVYDGLYCSSNGNYGSTLFDISPGELIFYLCDACLEKKGHIVRRVVWEQPEAIVEKNQTFTEYHENPEY